MTSRQTGVEPATTRLLKPSVTPRKHGVAAALFTLAAMACAVFFAARSAAADGQVVPEVPVVPDLARLDGPWTLAAVTEAFTIQQWGGPCGPPPVPRTIVPPGPVTVRTDGAELFIDTGKKRSFRTDQCLDPMTTLLREAHSTDGKTWRTRCATPASDPRHAVVNAAYFLTGDDFVVMSETGRYEFTIKGSRCVADVSRQGSLRRVVAAAPLPSAGLDPWANSPNAESATPNAGSGRVAPTSQPDLTTAPTKRSDCSSPGDPTRLEVRPSRKLLRLGQEFTFRARVLDANGCPTETPIHWSVGAIRGKDGRASALSIPVDSTGKVTVPGGPADDLSDATFDVTATAAGRSARSSVEVTSAAAYEALLAQSGLGPNGQRDEPAVAILATSSLGGSNVRAEDSARRRRVLFIWIIAAFAVTLGIIGVFAAFRARRGQAAERIASERHSQKMREYQRQKSEREDQHAAQMRAHLESLAAAQRPASAGSATLAAPTGPQGLARAVVCPSCRREFSQGGAFCPFDANRLVAIAGHEGVIGGPVGGVCPSCRRGFNPGVRLCPHDGDELVPAALVPPQQTAARGKICPTCGDHFEGNSAFCSKDGTQLVLLN